MGTCLRPGGGGIILRWTNGGVVEILLVASCFRTDWDKLRPDELLKTNANFLLIPIFELPQMCVHCDVVLLGCCFNLFILSFENRRAGKILPPRKTSVGQTR